jgi:hypothetical protein
MGAGIGVSVIQTLSATADVISFGNGSTQFSYLSVSDLSIWSSVASTAGSAIKLNDVSLVALCRVEIEGPFIGVNAISSTFVVLDNVTIKNPEASTGIGVIINGGNNYFLDKVLVYTATAVASCTNDGVYINPASGGTVQGVRFGALRASLNSGNGVNFGTSGTITSSQLNGCQILDNALAGINLQSGTYSIIDGCYIGGNSSASSGTSSGIKVAAGVSSFDIRTCRIGKSHFGRDAKVWNRDSGRKLKHLLRHWERSQR